MEAETDVRQVLPTIQVPALVIRRRDDPFFSPEEMRFVADMIPSARYTEVPGADSLPWIGQQGAFIATVTEFLASVRDEEAQFDRVLATLLFTDIVGSTQRAAQLGDRAWKNVLGRHHQIVRALLARYRGRELDTAGDGFFATFDGPARAIQCARSIVDAVKSLGIEIRAGCHTGEVELHDGLVGGIAVHIGSRVAALAGASEILVSSTVKDLVAGSGLAFEDAGEHQLKGVPDRWRLYRVVSASP